MGHGKPSTQTLATIQIQTEAQLITYQCFVKKLADTMVCHAGSPLSMAYGIILSAFLSWTSFNKLTSLGKLVSAKSLHFVLERLAGDFIILAVGVKYWNKQGGKCLCEEQDKERLFSFLGILGSE